MEKVETRANRNEQEIQLKQNVFGLHYTEQENLETKQNDVLVMSAKKSEQPGSRLPAR